MKTIFILHYHLHPGGVTRIIESQGRALLTENPATKIVILTGDDDLSVMGKMPVDVVNFDALNYLMQDAPRDLESKFESIQQFLSNRIKPGDVVHAHNINLGKNPLLTLAVYELAQQGIGVVYHCHDFAEDRPENWRFLRDVIESHFGRTLNSVLYPEFKNVSFIVLNSIDKTRLESFGVKKKKIFHLPNPVGGPSKQQSRDEAQAVIRKTLGLSSNKLIVTYPVRVIRRKNIGEFILFASLFRDRAHWLVTQPPRNPVEIKPYVKWKQFCSDRHINVHFEAGERVDFESLMFASDACITTSVQEGFGMAFMEPWSFGVPVIGRDIPKVTQDLRDFGIQLPLLYQQLNVNIDNVQHDFALLSMDEQMLFIAGLIDDAQASRTFLDEHPFLEEMLLTTPLNVVKHNQNILKEKFSISAYGQLLYTIYDSGAQGS